MKSFGHLQEFELTLTSMSPVFIGSGAEYHKTEYLYDAREHIVHFLDREKLFQYLLDFNHIDRYEQFILSGNTDMRYFLKQRCHISPTQLSAFIKNSISASDALDQNHSLKNIAAFPQLPNGQMYIPGSSLKGCLRTVFLTYMLLKDKNRDRSAFPEKAEKLEHKYLHTLNLSERSSDAINSMMRGISVSDSAPISDGDMILCSKLDLSVDDHKNPVNVIRQCVAPQAEMKFRLTLDQSVLKHKITLEWIQHAIEVFNRFYIETYTTHFPPVEKEFDEFGEAKPFVILGGGSGYFGKNLVYPYYDSDYNKAVRETAAWMRNTFKRHHHDRDIANGISPHMKKITIHKGCAYTMGLCRVDVK